MYDAKFILENVFGTIGSVCWSFQLVPQVIKSHKTKDTEGLSVAMLFLWLSSCPPLAAYGISQGVNIPLIAQPQFFGFFSIICIAQCCHYQYKWSSILCTTVAALCMAMVLAIELSLIRLNAALQARGDNTLITIMGITSAFLITFGVVPQFIEIWRFKEVKGISYLFLGIDLAGGVFSTISLACRDKFDYLEAASYMGVVILEIVMLALIPILNPLAARRRQALGLPEDPDEVVDPQSIATGEEDVPAEWDAQTSRHEGFAQSRRASAASIPAVLSRRSSIASVTPRLARPASYVSAEHNAHSSSDGNSHSHGNSNPASLSRSRSYSRGGSASGLSATHPTSVFGSSRRGSAPSQSGFSARSSRSARSQASAATMLSEDSEEEDEESELLTDAQKRRSYQSVSRR